MNTELFKRFIAVYFITDLFLYILSGLYPLAVLNLTFGKDKKWLFLYDDIEKIMEKLEKDVEKEKIPKKNTERECRNFLTNIPESLILKRKNKKEGLTFFFYYLTCSRTSSK